MKRRQVTGIASIGASTGGSSRGTRSCTYIATCGAVWVQRHEVAISWLTRRYGFICPNFAGLVKRGAKGLSALGHSICATGRKRTRSSFWVQDQTGVSNERNVRRNG